MTFPKPALDHEIATLLAALPTASDAEITPETIPILRQFYTQVTLEYILAGKSIKHEEHTVPVPGGEIILSVFKPTEANGPTPAIYHIHGGGTFMGNRFSGLPLIDGWIEKFGVTIISVEYRLTPEHPYPVPFEDCYAGFKWVGEHTTELGIDKSRLMTAGHSAGANFALAVALRARDDNGPKICAQLLMCPMLDHRNETTSVKQFWSGASWTGKLNAKGWEMYLGDHGKDGAKIDILASPGIAEAADYVGLPTTFVDVGAAEAFRDECLTFIGKLAEVGVATEFHIWAGACHAFDQLFPTATVSKRAGEVREGWAKSILSQKE